jgi:hypothetical protein
MSPSRLLAGVEIEQVMGSGPGSPSVVEIDQERVRGEIEQ